MLLPTTLRLFLTLWGSQSWLQPAFQPALSDASPYAALGIATDFDCIPAFASA